MNRWEDTDSDSIVAADSDADTDADVLMMARQADGQMSIKEDAEGDIDAAAYAAEYADAVHVWGWNLIPVGGMGWL